MKRAELHSGQAPGYIPPGGLSVREAAATAATTATTATRCYRMNMPGHTGCKDSI